MTFWKAGRASGSCAQQRCISATQLSRPAWAGKAQGGISVRQEAGCSVCPAHASMPPQNPHCPPMAWRTLEGRAVRTGQLVAGRHRQPPAVLHSAHDLHGGGRIRVKGGAAFSKPESGASSSAGAGSRSTSQHWLCAPSTGFACPRGTPRSAAPTAQRQILTRV